ncbi:hypothetical protein ABIB86_000441 [Bradyrhizobium sp. JR1.7]|uniref:glycine-rich domain-containing protein n=1 Tax=unclassified Bradyrhizobium TaxID=2631580 RepID=UPI003390E419
MLRGPIRFTNASGGTGDFVYPGPTIDMQSPAAAGAVNGAVYVYYAQSLDMVQWEIGSGAYTSASGTFARTAVAANSNGDTAKISFTNPPQIVVFDTAAPFVAAVRTQVFAANGTYTPSAGMLYCVIECVGGGGGGGGVAGAATGYFGAGGGASGGYSKKTASAATIGASQAVTIGPAGSGGASGANNGSAGGDTSVGSLCIAKGGSGGTAGSNALVGQGGAGGIAGTGDLAIPGAPGGNGFYNGTASNIQAPSGCGGSSTFGGGAPGVWGAGANSGVAATGKGSGGSGAYVAAAASNAAGGAGASGTVIITEYCSQ